MGKLWIKVLTGKADDLGMQALHIDENVPGWMIHGGAVLEQTEEEQAADLYSLAIFGEEEFGRYSEPGALPEGISVDTRVLSEEDMEHVMTAAVRQAYRLLALRCDVADYGDILLKKHPEMRDSDSDLEAYYNAALAERKAVFTPEDYEYLSDGI